MPGSTLVFQSPVCSPHHRNWFHDAQPWFPILGDDVMEVEKKEEKVRREKARRMREEEEGNRIVKGPMDQ